MNSTQATPNYIQDYYIVCSISGAFALTAVALSCIILILIKRTKPRLHTVRHLLMCNTAVASILYCLVQCMNYAFLLFLPGETSDIACRWRAYFSYVTLCGIVYSFLAQAISRLFIAVFSTKYKWLTTFKIHHILISIQWFVSIIISLPAVVTKDVYFRRNTLCWVPLRSLIHVCYTYVAYYTIPVLSICLIYVFIYYRVKTMANQTQILLGSVNHDKRNLELLRNILILVFIYLTGAIPTILFLLTSNRVLYLIGIVTISLTVAIEKLFTILLDRELRQVVRLLFTSRARVIPLNTTLPAEGPQETVRQTQRNTIQT